MISKLDDYLEINGFVSEPNRTYFIFDQYIPINYQIRVPLHSFFPDEPDDVSLSLPSDIEITCIDGFTAFTVKNPDISTDEYINVYEEMTNNYYSFLDYYFKLIKFPIYTKEQIQNSLPKDEFVDDVDSSYFE